MGEELAVIPTGEVVRLDKPHEVALAMHDLDRWERDVLAPAKRALREALIGEADRQGAYTLRYGDTEVKVDGPDVADHKWENVPGMLAKLEAAGLPAERADALARPVTTWKVDLKEAMRISKNPVYRKIIAEHHHPEPKTRYTKVKRAAR